MADWLWKYKLSLPYFHYQLHLGAGWNDLILEVEIFIGTIPLREQTVVHGLSMFTEATVPVQVRYPGQHIPPPAIATSGQSSHPTSDGNAFVYSSNNKVYVLFLCRAC